MRKFFVVLSTLLFVICICSACGKTVVVDENCEQCHAAIVGKWSYLTKDEALRQVIFNEDGTCSLNNKKDEWSTACYDDVHNVRIRSTREFIRFDETKLYYDGDEYLNGKRYRYVRVDYDNWSEFFSSNFYDTFELYYEFGDYQTNDKDGNMIFYKGISFYAKPKDLDKVKLIPGIAVEFVFAEEGMPSTIKLDWDAREILSIEHSGDIKDVSNVKKSRHLTSYSNETRDEALFPIGSAELFFDEQLEGTATFEAPIPVEITCMLFGWVLIEN